MSDDAPPESLLEIFRDTILVRINLSTYERLRNVDCEEFFPLIPAFGFLIYSFGVIIIFVIISIILIANAVTDGLTWSDITAAPTALLIGSVVLWYLIRQVTNQIEFLTGRSGNGSKPETSILKLSVLTFLGMLFWIIGFLLRIHFVPGIDSTAFYASFPGKAAPAISFLIRSFAIDVVYFGIMLIGTGVVLQGVYGISRELTQPESPSSQSP